MKEEKPQSEHAVFTFGRFNPPTTGHKKLVNRVVSHAWKNKADHFIFASHTEDPKKNPLTHAEKNRYLKTFFPHANVHPGTGIKTPIDAVKHLAKKGYKKVTMMVGADRQPEFHNLLHKYNGKEYNIPSLEVVSAAERDPDTEGITGMSASKMREHARNRNFAEFRKGVPNKAHARELYQAVRKGMKLENFQNRFKALFLVGGPGSGKDFIINTILDEANILELPLDKLYKAIVEQTNIEEFDDHSSLIINGNADNLDKIIVAKEVLESMEYETAMVYVYTSDEESKARNDERIARGAKTFTEEFRKEKYDNSVSNMHSFLPLFEHFHIFDNSNDFSMVNESKKEEIIGWLEELGEVVSKFFEEEGKYKPFSKSFVKQANHVPHQVKATASTAAKETAPKGYKRVKEGGFWKLIPEDSGAPGGIGDTSSGKNGSAEGSPIRNNYIFGKKKGTKKKTGEKAMTPPASPYDSRSGFVPSGSLGFTVSHYVPKGSLIKEKTFEKLRKNLASQTNNVDKE